MILKPVVLVGSPLIINVLLAGTIAGQAIQLDKQTKHNQHY